MPSASDGVAGGRKWVALGWSLQGLGGPGAGVWGVWGRVDRV